MGILPHPNLVNYNRTLVLEGENEDTPSEVVTVLEAVTMMILSTVCFIANLLACIVFYQRPALRSVSNRFVLSLVAANMASGLLTLPMSAIAIFMRQWIESLWWCHTSKVLWSALSGAGGLSLAVIAIDRYCAVMDPLRYHMTITRSRCRLLLGLIWSISGLLSLAPPLIFRSSSCLEHSSVVHLVRPTHRMWYASSLIICSFLAPLLLMLWVYLTMCHAARMSLARLSRHSVTCYLAPEFLVDSKQPNRRSSKTSLSFVMFREDGRAATTAMLVMTSFLVCWLPYFLWLILDGHLRVPLSYKILSRVLALIGCTINPFIYVYRNELARKDAVHILSCFVTCKWSPPKLQTHGTHCVRAAAYRHSTIIAENQQPVVNEAIENTFRFSLTDVDLQEVIPTDGVGERSGSIRSHGSRIPLENGVPDLSVYWPKRESLEESDDACPDCHTFFHPFDADLPIRVHSWRLKSRGGTGSYPSSLLPSWRSTSFSSTRRTRLPLGEAKLLRSWLSPPRTQYARSAEFLEKTGSQLNARPSLESDVALLRREENRRSGSFQEGRCGSLPHASKPSPGRSGSCHEPTIDALLKVPQAARSSCSLTVNYRYSPNNSQPSSRRSSANSQTGGQPPVTSQGQT